MSSTDEVGRHGASPIRNGGRSENALAGGAKPTPSSPGDARRNHPAKRELHEKNTLDAKQKDTVPSLLAQRSAPVAWKIRPARLAMSLRVERLQTTRPSLPLRAPPQAPPGYAVCRLRLGIAGISVRASHPGFGRVSLARLIESTATVTVRWNGYDDGVGAFSAWRVPLVAPAGNGAVAGSGQNDLLLPVPKNNRRGLLLSLSVQRPNFRQVSQSTGGWIAKEVIDDNHHFSGVVNIGWDGLSCLPVNRTDFFVDAQDGLFMTNESGRRPSLAVTLELLAVLQTPRQPLKQAAASTLPVADASTSTVSRQSSAGIAGGYGSEECSSAGNVCWLVHCACSYLHASDSRVRRRPWRRGKQVVLARKIRKMYIAFLAETVSRYRFLFRSCADRVLTSLDESREHTLDGRVSCTFEPHDSTMSSARPANAYTFAQRSEARVSRGQPLLAPNILDRRLVARRLPGTFLS